MKRINGKLKIELASAYPEFKPGSIFVTRQEIARIWHTDHIPEQAITYYIILKVDSGTPVAYTIPKSEYDALKKYDMMLTFGPVPLIIPEYATPQVSSPDPHRCDCNPKPQRKMFTNAIMELEI